MKVDPVIWRYSRAVSARRVRALYAWHSFEEIVAKICSARMVSADWEPFQTAALPGCRRSSVVLRVAKSTYDAFYNAPVGIRGCYAASQSAGEEADRLLISSLEPRLLDFAAPRVTGTTRQLLQKSLRGQQAKTWIVESEVEEQTTDGSIIFEPWERATLAGEGLCAPVGKLLEVKGGWLDPAGNERCNPAKKSRSYTIHKTGYI